MNEHMYEQYVRLREAKGLSDYQVQKETGLSAGTLYNWKNKKYVPKIDKLKKIADLFGVTVDYFLTD